MSVQACTADTSTGHQSETRQTPYRSVVVYPKGEEDNIKDIMLIDKCIQVYQEWQDIAPSPKCYQEKVANDFKTIDLSVIDNIIPRIS